MADFTIAPDIVSLLAALGSLVLILVFFGRLPFQGAGVTLCIIFSFQVIIAALELLEHRLPSPAIIDYANLARVLVAASWGVFFYSSIAGLAERDLRESEQKYRDLVETSHDWIWESDAQGRITYCSPVSLEILGYAPEEILGKLSTEFMPPAEAARIKAVMRPVLAKASPVTGLEAVSLHKDGRSVVMETTAVPFFDSNGLLLGFRGANHDITRRKDTEQAVLLAKEGLERQNLELQKIAAIKDGLIRDVSHELKTPVAKMAMQLELLRARLGGGAGDEDTAGLIEVMESSLKRQERNIRNILDLSRLEGGGRKYVSEEFPLRELFDEIVADFGHEFKGQGIRLRTNLSDVTIRSDRAMLWHVFSNIIGNAIKFRSREREPEVCISAERCDGATLVTISDNGVGIDAHDLDRVFERFYKANSSIEGSGVGLSITRMIVEDLGGTIRISSEGKDRGTTVQVRL